MGAHGSRAHTIVGLYEIALSVAACLRAGTRADVAWMVDTEGLNIEDWSNAVMFTSGGGKIGSLAGGALDGRLADQAGRFSAGRLIEIELSEIDALVAGLPAPSKARCMLVPADTLPHELWDLAIARQSFALTFAMDGDEVSRVALHVAGSPGVVPAPVEQAFATRSSVSIVTEGEITSFFRARPQLVVVGAGPVAAALVELAAAVGWRARSAGDANTATGLIATLSNLDKVVVADHDLELSGSALLAALESDAGYIGSLGGRRMQENRADWLAYRGVEDLTRIHGPAGLEIGADTPAEIAVSILAEAIAAGSGSPPRVD